VWDIDRARVCVGEVQRGNRREKYCGREKEGGDTEGVRERGMGTKGRQIITLTQRARVRDCSHGG
jgi:hypothetical protein